MESLFGIPGLPTSSSLTGGLNTQNHQRIRYGVGPADQQSAVPESDLLRSQAELLQDQWAGIR